MYGVWSACKGVPDTWLPGCLSVSQAGEAMGKVLQLVAINSMELMLCDENCGDYVGADWLEGIGIWWFLSVNWCDESVWYTLLRNGVSARM